MLDSQLIYKNLQGQLHLLDQNRVKRYKKVEPFKWTFWTVLIAGGTGIAALINQNVGNSFIIYLIAYLVSSFIFLLAFIFVRHYHLTGLKKEFTTQIAPKITGSLHPSFSYQYNGKIPEQTIRDSRLFSSFNSYKCQDLVSGDLGKSNITFAEIKLVHRTHGTNRSSDKNKNTSSTVFSGIFFQAEIPIQFPTGIWLVPKYQWKSFFGDSRKGIKLDHPAMKPYRIYVSSKEIADQILQPYILDRIGEVNDQLKSQKLVKRPLNYHFEGNKVQVAISTRYKFMEPKLNESIDNEAFIKKQTDLVNVMGSLLNELTLA